MRGAAIVPKTVSVELSQQGSSAPVRRRRSTYGKRRAKRVMLPRDVEMLRFIACQRITTAGQVRSRYGGTLANTYVRLNVLRDRGLLVHDRVLHLHPGVYRATRKGLGACGLSGARWDIDLFSYEHDLDLTSLYMELEQEFGEGVVLGSRELRLRAAEFAITSAQGRRRFPDLVVERHGDGQPLFVELERAARRDAAIDSELRAYLRSGHVGGVLYLVSAPNAERALRQALARVTTPPGLFEVRKWRSPNRRENDSTPVTGLNPQTGIGRVGPSRHFGRKSGGARTITKRDRAIVRWLARQRMVTAKQVQAHFGVSISTIYLRLNILYERGLVSHDRILHGEDGVFRATEDGLAFAGVTLKPCELDLLSYRHDLELTTLCLELEREFGPERIVTERELWCVEADSLRREFAVDVGGRRHFPDLAVERYDGERPLLVELERTGKSAPSLNRILRGFVGARHIAGVRYYACTPSIERKLRAGLAAVAAPKSLIEVRRRPGE